MAILALALYLMVLLKLKLQNESGSVPAGGEKNRFYFDDSVGIQTVTGVKIGDKVTGSGIPDGSFVTRVNRRRLIISNDVNTGVQTIQNSYNEEPRMQYIRQIILLE